MNIITIEEQAFYELVNKIVAEVRQQLGAKPRDKWIDGEEAMQMLRIKSKTTLQKLRDEGKIRFSQPEKKIILYDRDSIEKYLENHAQNTF
ncbi:MAG: DNA-binding protein [Bacteroidetes bacterium 47-18]|nr:MAG: DNA-binding protein [Bacteroidetes bacterium 47-18]